MHVYFKRERMFLRALTIGEEGILASSVLVKVLFERGVFRQTRVRLQPQQLRVVGAVWKREVRVVKPEPLLRPALSARHADTFSAFHTMTRIFHVRG